METPFQVTVVVPCYNYANYLPECIESLVSQTYPIKEIIIVNDGSPDNTTEVANELANSLMFAKYLSKNPNCAFIVIDKENGGLSSARNAGIKEATGEFIMCLDADDKLTPAGIEEHMKLIEDEYTIAQCALMEFGERHISYVPNGATLDRILRGNTIFCNAMFSKKVWEAIGGYDESDVMKWGWEDYEFWIRCLEYGCYVKTSEFIALRYRAHANNMTKMTTHPHWDDLKKYIQTKHNHLYERYNIPTIIN